MKRRMTKSEKEFEILENTIKDAIVLEFKDEILALVNKFGDSGQSGGSAPYVAQIISDVVKKLCLHQPITPIMGTDDEWNDISEISCEKNGTIFQNKRNSAIFKDNTGSYYLDAIIFKGKNSSFTGNADFKNTTISSNQYIKSFPFEPKTFYVDVIETEWSDKNETVKQKGGGWWTSVVKDEKQLKPIFKYYKNTNNFLLRKEKLKRINK